MSKLVPATDDESIEGVFRIQLSSGFPIEPRLRSPNSRHPSRADCGSSVVSRMMIRGLHWNRLRWGALRDYRWILFNGNKLEIFKLQIHVIDGFKNQIAVLVADVTEFRGGHTNEHHFAYGV